MIDGEAAGTHTGRDRGMFGDFRGLDNDHVLSVFEHDYEEFCFYLDVMESPSLMLTSHGITYV